MPATTAQSQPGSTENDRPPTEHGMTGAEVIVQTLESLGVEVIFGMCGHTNLAMLDAVEHSSIRFIGVRHEQVAAHAADGYFRALRKPAAVLTTIGPGLTNAITGLGDAALDGAGMIVIAGDVPTYFSARGGFQELNLHGEAQQVELIRPIVKRAWKAASRQSLGELTIQAFQQAVAPTPGPVLIDVPMDLFSARSTDPLPDVVHRGPTSHRVLADETQVARIAEALAEADRPVLYAGGGAAASSGAQAALVKVAEHLGVPVVTTMSGQGVMPKDHELYAGYTATVGTPVAHRLVNDADLVVALGTQLAEMETSSFAPDIAFRVPPTRLIQVDLDPTRIGRFYPVEVGVIADVATFLEQLATTLDGSVAAVGWRSTERFRNLRAQLDEWNDDIATRKVSDAQPIAVERLLADIRTALPRNGIFLTDVGIRHQVAQQFEIYSPETVYVASGWGTMGGAVAAALGAKVAHPERAVVSEVGDGAFSSILSAVVTAVEHDIPVVWVVMNNFAYSSISVYQHKHQLGSLGTSFEKRDGTAYNPDFAAFAEACGARGRVVTDPGDLLPALKEALDSNRPTVLDVHTEPAPRTRASGWWDVNDLLASAASSR